MKITIIGYKNHSVRLQKLLKGMNLDSVLWNHHTDDFSDVVGSDCVLISSPSDTHIKYIKRIIDESPSSYIFCEKPPVTDMDDLKYLINLDINTKRKIFFNFNYRFSHLAKLIKDTELDLGKPVYFNFVSSHGLALKDSYKDNWRFTSTNNLMGVYGTVGIHYLDLCLWLLGECENVNVRESHYSDSKTPDSVTIEMKFKNGCVVNIFVSYVTPFINQSTLIFDDAILELDNGVVKLFNPRDEFDENGNFRKPDEKVMMENETSKDYYDLSLNDSLEHFINGVKNGVEFSIRDFDTSIHSNSILLKKVYPIFKERDND
jgi:predicted dehydrogenase